MAIEVTSKTSYIFQNITNECSSYILNVNIFTATKASYVRNRNLIVSKYPKFLSLNNSDSTLNCFNLWITF